MPEGLWAFSYDLTGVMRLLPGVVGGFCGVVGEEETNRLCVLGKEVEGGERGDKVTLLAWSSFSFLFQGTGL